MKPILLSFEGGKATRFLFVLLQCPWMRQQDRPVESLRNWGCVCVCVWSLKRRARHQISHLPLRVGIISKCVMGYRFMTWQRLKKKLKTNLFIERFTASSQPCNFFFFNLFFLSFFLAKYLLWLGTDAHPVILLSTRRPFVLFTWAISISAHPL